jgi:hypothetical protein
VPQQASDEPSHFTYASSRYPLKFCMASSGLAEEGLGVGDKERTKRDKGKVNNTTNNQLRRLPLGKEGEIIEEERERETRERAAAGLLGPLDALAEYVVVEGGPLPPPLDAPTQEKI